MRDLCRSFRVGFGELAPTTPNQAIFGGAAIPPYRKRMRRFLRRTVGGWPVLRQIEAWRTEPESWPTNPVAASNYRVLVAARTVTKSRTADWCVQFCEQSRWSSAERYLPRVASASMVAWLEARFLSDARARITIAWAAGESRVCRWRSPMRRLRAGRSRRITAP